MESIFYQTAFRILHCIEACVTERDKGHPMGRCFFGCDLFLFLLLILILSFLLHSFSVKVFSPRPDFPDIRFPWMLYATLNDEHLITFSFLSLLSSCLSWNVFPLMCRKKENLVRSFIPFYSSPFSSIKFHAVLLSSCLFLSCCFLFFLSFTVFLPLHFFCLNSSPCFHLFSRSDSSLSFNLVTVKKRLFDSNFSSFACTHDSHLSLRETWRGGDGPSLVCSRKDVYIV